MTDFQKMAFEEGRRQAFALRETAPGLTGTEMIARQRDVPDFAPDKDYTSWPRGSALADEGQVWILEIPHNAAHYPGLRPGTNRACWGLAHTTDPGKAKPWVAPYGTSGLYLEGECCTWEGRTWRSLTDNNAYPPMTQGAEGTWEAVL